MLRIVAATRHDQQTFQNQSLLGRTMNKFAVRGDVFFVLQQCFPPNGLSDVFNAALAAADEADTILFTHDDVWIDDWFVPERLEDALARFAVVGIAGNRRRVPNQPAWAFVDQKFTWDEPEFLSGMITHAMTNAQGQFEKLDRFGPTPANVKLLDGVFLAAKVKTLRDAGVTFDPRFTFNFYDMDFCRSCEKAGLEMGTWPIAITHGSVGRFGNDQWKAAYAEYLRKWGE
jgi:hypothetical protein